jgi:DNA repair protein RadC
MQLPEQITLDLGMVPPPPPAPPRPHSVPIYSLKLVRDSSLKTTIFKIRSPRDVYNLMQDYIGDADREHFAVLLLDTKNQVVAVHTVSIGDLSSTIVHPREVFKIAVHYGAASVIVSHNHPSGDTTPSPEDIAVTKRLDQAGELLGIELLDHIILGDGRWTSLKEKGLF